MKKIKLFSATLPIPLKIEGEEVTDLSVNFYFVLNKTYGFTFLIDTQGYACTDRNPIKLWKRFLIVRETEIIKYMRRWERTLKKEKRHMAKIEIDKIDSRMTNGAILMTIYPNYEIEKAGLTIVMRPKGKKGIGDTHIMVDLDFWNAPYKGGE